MKYHIVYRTHNLINGKEYTGKHSTDDLNDGYYGSGIALNNAIRSYGIENFAVEILSFHDSEEAALAEEARIVDEDYVEREDTYNLTLGGQGGGFHIDNTGKIVVKDKDGNSIQVDKNDTRYLAGELRGIAYNMVNVKDKNGKTLQVSIDDTRYKSGELAGVNKGKITVIDSNGNTYQTTIDDPDYISKRITGTLKGKSMYEDMRGNIFQLQTDDDRIKSGEMTSIHKNKVTVKDKDGNTMSVSKDDPRYIAGLFVGIMKNRIIVKDKDGNTMSVSKDDPRYLSGELVGIMNGIKHKKKMKILECPYCHKICAENMAKRHHFDNCKSKQVSLT